MKILLVQPAPFEPGRLGLENIVWLSEPVALTQLAAMAMPEHEVRILDMRLEQDIALNEMLLEFEPDLVGTTSMTTDCAQARAVLETARSTLGESVFTIVGGHHPTLAPWDFEAECIDALCIGEGEETFLELIEHLDQGKSKHHLEHIAGLRFRGLAGEWISTDKRSQNRDLDSFPIPARQLIKKYSKEYFYLAGGPMASISTSRGCSFDCNFCAIWEFYERKTRFLSAERICDILETIEEDVVFFLDDNFLTNRRRLEALCDELEKRKIKKWFATQGRTDFIADNPELMKRLAKAGLMMVLSGYESNEENNLDFLLKRNTAEKNIKASKILNSLGIFSTGIFMVRQDFEEDDFHRLYAAIDSLDIALPLVAILTPLPGTQLYKERYEELLTTDARFFDLLHSVLPTKLPRQRFYELFTQMADATWGSKVRGIWAVVRRRPWFFIKHWRGVLKFRQRRIAYWPVMRDAGSHMRDEEGIIDADVTIANAPRRERPAHVPFPTKKVAGNLIQIRPKQPAQVAEGVTS
jgi:radical SAM superfamily enzyme YgiQ (UPF0313 family)